MPLSLFSRFATFSSVAPFVLHVVTIGHSNGGLDLTGVMVSL